MKVPLRVGMTVQIEVPVRDRMVACQAVVLALGNRTFDTTPPTRHGVRLPLLVDALRISITMPDAIYTLTCPLVKLTEDGVVFELPPEDAVQRVQRRNFVRVPTNLQATVLQWSHEREDYELPFMAELIDISGGGCSLLCPHELHREQDIQILVDLPEEGEVTLYGRVRRAYEQQTRRGRRTHAGVEFSRMEEAMRSKLIRYVFALQREQARKLRMARGES